MIEIEWETDRFIEKLQESDVCREYYRQRDLVAGYPELKQKIDEFRRRNFALQNEVDADALFDEVDSFEQEYADFRSNPIVNNFLAAELAFCRMYQEVTERISEAFAAQIDL